MSLVKYFESGKLRVHPLLGVAEDTGGSVVVDTGSCVVLVDTGFVVVLVGLVVVEVVLEDTGLFVVVDKGSVTVLVSFTVVGVDVAGGCVTGSVVDSGCANGVHTRSLISLACNTVEINFPSIQ